MDGGGVGLGPLTWYWRNDAWVGCWADGRLLRLKETVRKRKIKLTDKQIAALERCDPEFRERQIEVHATGEFVAVDTFFAGTLKGVGTVYVQTMPDCFSRYVWARLYTSKMPVAAVQILNNHVLPFVEDQGVKILENLQPAPAPPQPQYGGAHALLYEVCKAGTPKKRARKLSPTKEVRAAAQTLTRPGVMRLPYLYTLYWALTSPILRSAIVPTN